MSNAISKPKTSPKATWQGATKTKMSPRHTTTERSEPKHNCVICTSFDMWSIDPMGSSPTHTLKNLPPPNGGQGIMHHTVPLLHVVYWPYLVSPIHSRIYLFLPWTAGNDASRRTPFACGLLALWATASPTHSRIYPYHAKWEPLTWLVGTKMG